MNQEKSTYLDGYVARNGTKKLIFYTDKPWRKRESLLTDEELVKETWPNGQHKYRASYPRMWRSEGKEIPFTKLPFDDTIFKDLRWEDEPVKVRLTLKIE